jgi:saccharopine dehydrogenase-like NADP-dependent oxidoreductase
VVIVFVTVSGSRGGRLMQETYANKVYSRPVGGVVHSAIQVTTAAGICGVLDLLATGALPATGLVRQEDVPLAAFVANRFGRAYATEAQPVTAAA